MMMRFIFYMLLLYSFSTFAQIVPPYLSAFDSKIYSLKSKGIKDFTVKIVSPRLTKQMNELMIFGKIDEVSFNVYWTADPERYAIEVNGLPEGFKEIKEELKISILPLMDDLIPQTIERRFSGYKLSQGGSPREYVAVDSSGLAVIPSYLLKFDINDRLVEITGNRPIGSLVIVPNYEKTSFSDGKLVLLTLVSTSSENGQSLVSRKELTYGAANGIGVLTKVKIITEQKLPGKDAKPLILEDEVHYRDYKINHGEGFRYFLSDQAKDSP